MNAVAEMPKYKCFKEVWALKIDKISVREEKVTLSFADEKYSPIQVSAEWANKHSIEVGGYYVVYQDGYTSFSPAKAFEEGYELIK